MGRTPRIYCRLISPRVDHTNSITLPRSITRCTCSSVQSLMQCGNVVLRDSVAVTSDGVGTIFITTLVFFLTLRVLVYLFIDFHILSVYLCSYVYIYSFYLFTFFLSREGEEQAEEKSRRGAYGKTPRVIKPAESSPALFFSYRVPEAWTKI